MEQKIRSYYNVQEQYIEELYLLQVELLKLQKYISDERLRLTIIFEGRDTAGKGSALSRFTQFLNPRSFRSVALGKPTKIERGQWYFQRYIKRLPNAGQVVFFDRSWYNRAVVEPVMGFCSPEQYDRFMVQVNQFETMLSDDGMQIVKFWFSINATEQQKRIQKRLESPLEQWKVSPVDLAAQEKWESFTAYKKLMFKNTTTNDNPWIIIKGKHREERRIQAMRYVLSLYDYPDKSALVQSPDDSNIIVYRTDS